MAVLLLTPATRARERERETERERDRDRDRDRERERGGGWVRLLPWNVQSHGTGRLSGSGGALVDPRPCFLNACTQPLHV